jgi:hypothetical protein
LSRSALVTAGRFLLKSAAATKKVKSMTHEVTTYQAALEQFSSGKRLARLARFVRAPSDGRCDACGSTLPRRLYGLKNPQTERCYFVGENCLSRLLEAGLVARARYRDTAETAYAHEMQRRREEKSLSPSEARSEAIGKSLPEESTQEPAAEASVIDMRRQGRWIRQGGALVLEEESSSNVEGLLVIVGVCLFTPGLVEMWNK